MPRAKWYSLVGEESKRVETRQSQDASAYWRGGRVLAEKALDRAPLSLGPSVSALHNFPLALNILQMVQYTPSDLHGFIGGAYRCLRSQYWCCCQASLIQRQTKVCIDVQ